VFVAGKTAKDYRCFPDAIRIERHRTSPKPDTPKVLSSVIASATHCYPIVPHKSALNVAQCLRRPLMLPVWDCVIDKYAIAIVALYCRGIERR
jgi:hypothetical protein